MISKSAAKTTVRLSDVPDPPAFSARDTIDKTDSEAIVSRGDYGGTRKTLSLLRDLRAQNLLRFTCAF